MKTFFQKKSTKLFSLMILILLLSSGIFLKSQATNFSWNQISWSGGQSGTTATHSQDANGTWTNYSAKDANLNINGSGDAELKKADNWSETADADFNANTSKDTTLAISGNSIKLLKPNGAACSAAGDCQSNNCASNICAADFTCGTSTVTGKSPDATTYQTVLGADGRCWLSKNLGASRVATAYNDSQAYGWLYQWGRLTDGHQIATSGTISTQSSSDVPGHNKFILGFSDWRNPQNNNLWQGVNGTNNPCPTGWRLPTQAEWSTLVSASGITNANTAYSSSLKLVVGGFHNFGSDLIGDQGAEGYYWSSSPNSVFIYGMRCYSSGVNTAANSSRALGYSVRCIKN